MRRSSSTNIVKTRSPATPNSSASISVCPGNGEPLAQIASLFNGAVTMPAIAPWRASSAAFSTYCDGGPAALAVDDAVAQLDDVGEIEHLDQRRVGGHVADAIDGPDLEVEPTARHRLLQHTGVADHDRPYGLAGARIGQRLDDDLRTDPRRIADRHGHEGAIVIHLHPSHTDFTSRASVESSPTRPPLVTIANPSQPPPASRPAPHNGWGSTVARTPSAPSASTRQAAVNPPLATTPAHREPARREASRSDGGRLRRLDRHRGGA